MPFLWQSRTKNLKIDYETKTDIKKMKLNFITLKSLLLYGEDITNHFEWAHAP